MKTKKWAKELSLKVWEYLMDHPNIKSKTYLRNDIFFEIMYLKSLCPLCEILKCGICPLKNCASDESYFQKWFCAESSEERAKYACLIVEKIKAWDIYDD